MPWKERFMVIKLGHCCLLGAPWLGAPWLIINTIKITAKSYSKSAGAKYLTYCNSPSLRQILIYAILHMKQGGHGTVKWVDWLKGSRSSQVSNLFSSWNACSEPLSFITSLLCSYLVTRLCLCFFFFGGVFFHYCFFIQLSPSLTVTVGHLLLASFMCMRVFTQSQAGIIVGDTVPSHQAVMLPSHMALV